MVAFAAIACVGGPNAYMGDPWWAMCLVSLWWKVSESPHDAQSLQIHLSFSFTMYWMKIDGVEQCCGSSDEYKPTPIASMSTCGPIGTKAHTLDGMHANK
jgi:hypothetical protein